MLKKILISVLVLFVVVGIALAVFLMTFDVDQLRPQIVQELEKTIGHPVELGELSLEWEHGIALTANQLKVYEGEGEGKTVVLSLDSASTVLRLMPLLRQSIQVTSVYLSRPVVHVLRNAQGEVAIRGIRSQEIEQAPSGEKSASGPSQPVSPMMSFLIQKLHISDGKIYYKDAFVQPAIDIEIKDLDLTLKDVSLTRPTTIEAALAIFSKEQNLNASARLYLPSQLSGIELKDVQAETDLEELDLKELKVSIPQVKELGLEKPLKGKVTLDIEQLKLDSQGELKNLEASIQVQEGVWAMRDIASPIENLKLDVDADMDSITINNLSANFAKGSFAAEGAVKEWLRKPLTTMKMTLNQVDVEHLAVPVEPNMPYASGLLSSSFQGTIYGKEEAEVLKSLNVKGQATLEQGVIHNLNLLSQVFNHISVIPGLREKLESRLSDKYKEKLTRKETVLEKIDQAFAIREGRIILDGMDLKSDSFDLTGDAGVGFDGQVQGRAILNVDPELSDAFMRSVHELEYLMNEDKELQIPLTLTGQIPTVVVLPDLGFLTSRLAVEKTKEVIQGFFQKQAKPETTAEPSDPNAGAQEVVQSTGEAKESGTTDPVKLLEDLFFKPKGE